MFVLGFLVSVRIVNISVNNIMFLNVIF